MAAATRLTETAKDFLQRSLAKTSLGARGDHDGVRLLVSLNEASILELLDEIAHAHTIVRDAVLTIQLSQPVQRLRRIPSCMEEKLLEQIKQRVERRSRDAVATGVPLGVSESHGGEMSC